MSKAPELWGREEALVESQHLDMFSRFSKSFAPYWAHVWARPSTGAQTEAMLMLACFTVLTVLTIKIWFKNEKLIFGVRTFIENVRTVFENREKLAHRRCNGDGELPGAEDGAATWCKREAKAWFGVRTSNMPTCTELFKHLQIKRNFNQVIQLYTKRESKVQSKTVHTRDCIWQQDQQNSTLVFEHVDKEMRI